MKDEIKKSSPFAVPFMIANSEEYRGIMQRKATQTGIAQILKYEGGAKKYLGETESHITNMSTEFPKILDDLEGLKEKTTRAAMRIVGRALNVHEENIALKELREEEASLQIDYAAVDTLNKLRQETMGKTVSLSLQKAAAKKAKEETRNREEGSSERSPETIKWGYLPGGDETENLTGKPSREKIEEFKELIKSRLEEMIRISRAAA